MQDLAGVLGRDAKRPLAGESPGALFRDSLCGDWAATAEWSRGPVGSCAAGVAPDTSCRLSGPAFPGSARAASLGAGVAAKPGGAAGAPAFAGGLAR